MYLRLNSQKLLIRTQKNDYDLVYKLNWSTICLIVFPSPSRLPGVKMTDWVRAIGCMGCVNCNSLEHVTP